MMATYIISRKTQILSGRNVLEFQEIKDNRYLSYRRTSIRCAKEQMNGMMRKRIDGKFRKPTKKWTVTKIRESAFNKYKNVFQCFTPASSIVPGRTSAASLSAKYRNNFYYWLFKQTYQNLYGCKRQSWHLKAWDQDFLDTPYLQTLPTVMARISASSIPIIKIDIFQLLSNWMARCLRASSVKWYSTGQELQFGSINENKRSSA